MKIALVDDSREVGEMFKVLADQRHVDLTFISSPLDALKFLSDNEVDVAIIDLKMPYMDGIRLVKEIKKNQDQKHMPHPEFVCYTGKSLEGELGRMLDEVGFTKIYHKPFYPGDILNDLGCSAT